jgi:hypothetical protein
LVGIGDLGGDYRAFFLSAILVAYLAALHRTFGIVKVTRGSAVASAIGIVRWSLAEAPWQPFPAPVQTGAEWSITSGAAVNAMVSPWFNRRRAVALSHAFNGASVGGLLVTG